MKYKTVAEREKKIQDDSEKYRQFRNIFYVFTECTWYKELLIVH